MRGATTKVPGKTELERYIAKGLTQQQIVDAWEEDSGTRVSRSAIAMAIARFDLASAHPRGRYEDMLPWHVAVEHRMHYDARMLRAEARRRRGLPLKDDDKRRLTTWKLQLQEQDAVVTYDARTPDGFHWTPRTEEDDDLVRRPKRRKR